jgi:hypothetical protein
MGDEYEESQECSGLAERSFMFLYTNNTSYVYFYIVYEL